ncbi:hypothetical protein RclHR1_07410003 [Rhizophagus clarus]|uniref:BTB/POZ domain-containing protein n=1 Tax=Rhizophagus clarus TaxID=94130 RepID=A0A2Z6SKY3_9GLOM|nr:hypothetical protein RclHR1_07410003 [Rhizophagus clarus]GES85049.1 BTB/POZ domain-containing protein [Rhizophagus clarus]
MTFEYSQELASDLEKLFETDEGYDVIIYVDDNSEIHAFSNILRIRSQYFRTAFSNELTKKKDGRFIFNFPNISPRFFKIILRFIYCGKIDLAKLQGPEILKLLTAADELKVHRLLVCIQEYLVKHQHEFLQQDPLGILKTVYQRESLTDLWNYCLEKICARPDISFKSDKIVNLEAPVLELLLKRDDLSLYEIDIWNNLIKWCFSQNPSIQQDADKWNNDEIVTMERIIHRFIPLIRFCHISSDDFINKVHPFKRIIPEDLHDKMLIFHMAKDKQVNIDTRPPRKPKLPELPKLQKLSELPDLQKLSVLQTLTELPSQKLPELPPQKFDSLIVDSRHFAIFSSWIKKKNDSYYNVNNIPYNFNLLYRSNRESDAATFHAKCDNKGPTIVIVRLRHSNGIVGGYNPFFWDIIKIPEPTLDSFIFSFKNKAILQTAKVGYSNGYGESVGSCQGFGPIFGNHELAYDNSSWYRLRSSCYPNVDIPLNNLSVDLYEVFQIVEKFTSLI